MSGRTKLNRKQESAIAALLTAPTHAAAAAAAGVGEATLYRWLKLPEFRWAFRNARRRLVDDAVVRLQAATGRAVDALERNLTAGQPAVQVRAAVAVLDQLVKLDPDRQQALTPAQAMIFVEHVIAAIQRHVTDPAAIDAMVDEFRRLVGGR
jgi:hypothetical protein